MIIHNDEETFVMLITNNGVNWYCVKGTDNGCAIEMYKGHYEYVNNVFVPDIDEEDYEKHMIEFEKKLQDYININNI